MQENIIRLKVVNQILQEIDQDFVFVGGATVSLYAPDSGRNIPGRPTDHVDVVVEIASYGSYAKLDEKLLGLGFKNDITSGVICRYVVRGIIVDVMPTEEHVLGFNNKWYPEAFKNAITYPLDRENVFKIFSLPYFIAAKWDAFLDRGQHDYRTSKDFEDLVYIFEHVNDFKAKIDQAPENLKTYLKDEFSIAFNTFEFNEGLIAQISRGGDRQIKIDYVKTKLRESFDIDIPRSRGYTR